MADNVKLIPNYYPEDIDLSSLADANETQEVIKKQEASVETVKSEIESMK